MGKDSRMMCKDSLVIIETFLKIFIHSEQNSTYHVIKFKFIRRRKKGSKKVFFAAQTVVRFEYVREGLAQNRKENFSYASVSKAQTFEM